MAYFPIFIDISGRKCVIAGGGDVAARKATTLLEFDADITVVSPEFVPYLKALGKEGRVKLIEREFADGDLDGAFIAIAATSDRITNRHIYECALKCNIFIDMADSHEKDSFVFPSVVKRGEVVAGISTSGTYPALSKRIRRDIESAIPEGLSESLELLKEYRNMIINRISDREKKEEVLNRILDIVYNANNDSIDDLKNKIDEIVKEYA